MGCCCCCCFSFSLFWVAVTHELRSLLIDRSMMYSCGGVWGSVFRRCNNNLKRFVGNLDWVCCNLVVLRSSRSAAGSSCGLAMFVCWSAILVCRWAWLIYLVRLYIRAAGAVDVRHANCFIVAARSRRSALVSRVPQVLLRSYRIMTARETHTQRDWDLALFMHSCWSFTHKFHWAVVLGTRQL